MYNLAILVIGGTVLGGGAFFLLKNKLIQLFYPDDEDDIEHDGEQRTRIRHGNL